MRKSGRPISLRCQSVTLADLDQLELLRDQPNTVMNLVLFNDQSFVTLFRYADRTLFEIAPIVRWHSYNEDDFRNVRIKLVLV